MSKIKNGLLRLYQWSYFPFIPLFLLYLVFYLFCTSLTSDDLYFSEVLKNDSLFHWLSVRYQSWSSRLIIETLLTVLFTLPLWIFRLLNVFFIAAVGICLSRIFNPSKAQWLNWFIVILIFLYPMRHLHSAGWFTTSINYIWPLSCLLISLLPAQKLLYGKPVGWLEYGISIPALLLAANQEQFAAAAVALFGGFFIYLLIIKKKMYPMLLVQSLLSFVLLLFILTAPGNSFRYASEISTWFPDYDSLSLFDKAQLGISATLQHFVDPQNYSFMFFSLILAACVFQKHKFWFYRLIGMVPLLFTLFFPILLDNWLPDLKVRIPQMSKYGIINIDNFQSLKCYAYLCLLCGIFFAALVSLYLIFGNHVKSLFSIYILLIGLATRVIMGFTPTHWASADRTYILLYFAIISCCIMLLKEWTDCRREKAGGSLFV